MTRQSHQISGENGYTLDNICHHSGAAATRHLPSLWGFGKDRDACAFVGDTQLGKWKPGVDHGHLPFCLPPGPHTPTLQGEILSTA